uniref:Uncharacterized protein n=1 Tax=viral metagenome TaxID=1070528 RepID=A0A6M3XY79_9ZZZZ
MKECCHSDETKKYYNNIAYHLSKSVIEKHLKLIREKHPKIENFIANEFLNPILMDLDEVFPSEDNAWNYLFERKLIDLGFIHLEDKKLIKKFKEYYEKKANKSINDREKFKECEQKQ